ncbi:DJ-1 family glyoxalase III [Luteolibacter sp. AS25]|uniref:DJ-1 family glyoxalase III n=1 Tax=Luteolibacter sp. AS25 TaxID=3135776 RepID=UPI00398BA459
MKRVICLLENGFEELEVIAPVDLLRRAEVEVVIAGVSGGEVTGRCGVRILADANFAEVSQEDFDMLFLPGGPAVMELRKNTSVMDFISNFQGDAKLVAAICAAPLLLKDAGILEGKRFTAHSTTREELPESTGESVEVDGEVITSRGAGTAVEFGLKLVEILCGKVAADEVGRAVMV